MAGPIEELGALASAARTSAPLTPYLDRVRDRAYTVTDDDVAALREAGLSEDEIFEATVSVAITEGLRRLEAARKVIG